MSEAISRLLAEARALAGSAARPTQGATTPETNFGRFLEDELARAATTLRRGEEIASAGLLGRASTREVVEAVSAAELALRRVTAVRDRVIAAYQEIMRMQI